MANTFIYNLTYAGVPFVSNEARVIRLAQEHEEYEDKHNLPPKKHQPLEDLIDELNRLIPFQYLEDFTLPQDHIGRNLAGMARKRIVGPWPNTQIKIGDWYYPNSASRWGVFRGLATTEMAIAMENATNGKAATFLMNCQPQAPNTAGKNYTLSTQMYMLTPRPLGQYGAGFSGLYLITLVDERYYWADIPVALKPINNSTTWNSLITTVATTLGISVTQPNVPIAYTSPEPDSQFWANSASSSFMFDAIAYNIGCTVVRALNGTYQLQTGLAASAQVTTNRGTASKVVRTAGGDLFNELSTAKVSKPLTAKVQNSIVPASVNVTYPKYIIGNDPVPHFVNSRYVNQRASVWLEDPYGDTFTINVPIKSGGSAVSGLAGTSLYQHTIHDTAKSLYSGEVQLPNLPINYSGLVSLAMQTAQDYYSNQCAAALDEIYPGTFAWVPEAIHDIIWTWSPRERQCTTRVMKTQWNQVIKEMQHTAPAIPGNTPTAPGVGGPSVAQTWRDSFSGTITSTIGSLSSGAHVANFIGGVNYFPTQNRWKGIINSGQSNVEIMMFEGTSGGTTVNIVNRGIDGTVQQEQGAGFIQQLVPNTNYGINLLTIEKGQFTFPKEWTSGGIMGNAIVPQIQTVLCLANSGVLINQINCYSGQIELFDTTKSSGFQYSGYENVWLIDRNTNFLNSGIYYEGQFVGFSAAGPDGKTAPVYITNEFPDPEELEGYVPEYNPVNTSKANPQLGINIVYGSVNPSYNPVNTSKATPTTPKANLSVMMLGGGCVEGGPTVPGLTSGFTGSFPVVTGVFCINNQIVQTTSTVTVMSGLITSIQ